MIIKKRGEHCSSCLFFVLYVILCRLYGLILFNLCKKKIILIKFVQRKERETGKEWVFSTYISLFTVILQKKAKKME